MPETMPFLADRPLAPLDVADIERRARLLPGVLSVQPGRPNDQIEVTYDPDVVRAELVRLQLESPYLRLAGLDSLSVRLRDRSAALATSEAAS